MVHPFIFQSKTNVQAQAMSFYRCRRTCMTHIPVAHLNVDMANLFFFILMISFLKKKKKNYGATPIWLEGGSLGLGVVRPFPKAKMGVAEPPPWPKRNGFGHTHVLFVVFFNALKLKTTIFFFNIHPCGFIHFTMCPLWF
jgi:hypothetical protein